MKNPKILIRILQILSVVSVAAIAIFLFDTADVFKKNGEEGPQVQLPKITRPRPAMDRTYRDFLESGDRAFFRNDFAAALREYQQAAALEQREYLAYEKMGDSYFFQKNYGAGRQNFELAASLNPANGTLKLKIVKSILGLRKIVEARTELEKIQLKTQETVYYEAMIAAFLNEKEKAEELFGQAIQGNDEKIKQNAQKFLDIYRDYQIARDAPETFLQVMLAQAYDQVGENAMAIELAFDAIKKQNDYRDAWIVLGHAFLGENKWLDSEDAFTKAIELDSSQPAAYFFRAVAEKNLNKNQQAIADFNAALRMGWQPKISAKLFLADIYFGMSDFQAAFDFYSDVVKTDASDINRFIRPIALAINHLSNPQEALSLAQIAFNAHPENAMAHNLLGWALIFNNDFAGARTHLSEAISQNPALDAAYLNMGQLSEKEGNVREALVNYQRAIDLALQSGNSSIEQTAQLKYDQLSAAGIPTINSSDQIQNMGTSSQSSAPAGPVIPGPQSLLLQTVPENSSQTQIPSLSLL